MGGEHWAFDAGAAIVPATVFCADLGDAAEAGAEAAGHGGFE